MNKIFATHTEKQYGFSLTELLITVAVIAVISMFAIPTYNNYATNARRADAQAALSGLSAAMERFFTENGSYDGAAGTRSSPTTTGAPWIYSNQSPVDSNVKYYDLTIQAATDSAYTIRATPVNNQAGDGILELNSIGIKRWDKNNDGDTSDTGENNWNRS